MAIHLNRALFLASGGARDVYLHPNNENICIKIQRTNGHQNINEKNFFKKHGNNPIFPEYYGEVETNLGTGLAFELIKDFNGEISKSLIYYLKTNTITKKEAKNHIQEIANEAISKRLLIHDGGLQNILLKKNKEGGFVPILIDGFGEKNSGIKNKLRTKYSTLAIRKTKKQINIMMNYL